MTRVCGGAIRYAENALSFLLLSFLRVKWWRAGLECWVFDAIQSLDWCRTTAVLYGDWDIHKESSSIQLESYCVYLIMIIWLLRMLWWSFLSEVRILLWMLRSILWLMKWFASVGSWAVGCRNPPIEAVEVGGKGERPMKPVCASQNIAERWFSI